MTAEPIQEAPRGISVWDAVNHKRMVREFADRPRLDKLQTPPS